jgi:hypothetical protein
MELIMRKTNLGTGIAWTLVVLLIGFSWAAKEAPETPLRAVPPPEPMK